LIPRLTEGGYLEQGDFKNDFRRRFDNLLKAGRVTVPNGAPGLVIVVSFALLCLLSAVLAWIDIRHGIIPDWLNLTIAGLGLSKAVMIGGAPAGLEAACEGAAIGATFWLLRRLYFAFREVQGLGLGDVKFLAAAGIWSGVAGLPVLVLVAALTALACAGVMQLAGRQLTGQSSMSFGPFLAIGLLFTSALQQYGSCC
jgi:leader peptidase (prepilin peptidase)/N-methyltransferase